MVNEYKRQLKHHHNKKGVFGPKWGCVEIEFVVTLPFAVLHGHIPGFAFTSHSFSPPRVMNGGLQSAISWGRMAQGGRVLPHVTIQTGRRDDVTRAKRSTAQVDPHPPTVSGRYRATNQARGVLPEDLLLVGKGGGQITVCVGLGEQCLRFALESLNRVSACGESSGRFLEFSEL